MRAITPVLLFGLAAAAAPRPAPPGRLVGVGGYRVHLYCTGKGQPTVFVVGAGFSVDWGLVQPEVAKFATICTYDPSGMAWSDPGPALNCRARVEEIHRLVQAAGVQKPLVLVGLSIGGCVARLYAAEFPAEVAGMVIVDHAFRPDPDPDASPQPMVVEKTPVVLSVQDISNFNRLPERLRQLHRWAAGLHPRMPNWEDVEDCLAQLRQSATGPVPLGDLPLVVVSTGNRAHGYARLQNELMGLSRNSRQTIASGSFHAVEIDQPEVVVDALREVLRRARKAP
jgi:pimeloyl-ACP methyl ester carboxylesterase